MKKNLIIFLSVLISTIVVNANELCSCNLPKDLASPTAVKVTNALGYNLITKSIAKTVINKLLHKNIDGDFNIEIESFSGIDLKKGKFKSIKIEGNNIASNGVHITYAKAYTMCDYNWVDYWNSPVVFHTDVPAYFNAEISEDDLNKSLQDVGTLKNLLNINLGGISILKLDNICFKLENDKIRVIFYLKVPFLFGVKPIKISFSGKLSVVDGKIVFDDVISESLKGINLSKIVDDINATNPFDFNLRILKGQNTKLSVNSVSILDNKVYVNGIINVMRSSKNE